ncbi:MAG: ECF transporter S component [Tissierellaceae bacterium]|jgi:riboflavin transporter FmnP|nr:ECF transporter S component [Tissierellaceae bacterium]
MEIKKQKINTKVLVKVGILSAISFLLMIAEFPLWFAPGFLKMDLSEIPALLGAFALGPVAGILIEFMKNVLFIAIRGSNSMMVGEIANFIVGSIFVYISGIVYVKNKSRKNAIIGMILGTIAMTVFMSIANYYVMIPFYAKLYGMNLDSIVSMGTALNSNITDFKSLIAYSIVPFNLFKGAVVTLITVLLYKRLSPILHK